VKLAIVGCGAMGRLFAAHLAAAGKEVWAYDIWAEHVAALARDGVIVHRGGTHRVVKLNATADATAPGIVDVALIFTKFGATRDAAIAAKKLIGPATLLVTLQNGLGNVEIIRTSYPDNPLLFGFTPLTSEVRAPGVIEASGAGRTCLWSNSGIVTPAMTMFCESLTQSGIDAALTPDIQTEIWQKLIVNCCFNPVCALTDLTVGQAMAQPDTATLIDGVCAEILALASAIGVVLNAQVARRYLQDIGTSARDHFPSMVADMRARRLTEIDCLNGAILRGCQHHGIPAPFNQSLVSLIRMKQSGWPAA
jgi:2-dehydropantoate 2-reductase